MRDLMGVQNLLVRQRLAGDAEDEAATRECWAKDSSLTIILNGTETATLTGRDEVAANTVEGWRNGRHSDGGHVYLHFDGPAEILPDGQDRARARSRVLLVSTEPGNYRVLGFAQYQDDVVFEDGAWRILHRTVRTHH